MGFGVPLAEWFCTSLKPMFQSLVLHGNMDRYLSLPAVERLWEEHQAGVCNHDSKLWNLLMLACWDARYHDHSRRHLLEAFLQPQLPMHFESK